MKIQTLSRRCRGSAPYDACPAPLGFSLAGEGGKLSEACRSHLPFPGAASINNFFFFFLLQH